MKTEIVEEICTILSAPKSEDLQEIILRAASCLENYRRLPSDSWPEDIKSAIIDKSDADKLKISLVNYIKKESPDSPELGSSVWALGKIVGGSDKVFLVDTLKRCLNKSPENLYQVMCVLDSLGEGILGPDSSLFDSKENKKKAIVYLKDK